MNSPTARSLSQLKKNGYIAAVVEKWNPYARIRQDLFGFIDIVAIQTVEKLQIKDDVEDGILQVAMAGVTGVQTTSTPNMLARIKKILAIPEAKIWLQNGNRIIVHGWSKKKTTGKRETYQLKERELTLNDWEPVSV